MEQSESNKQVEATEERPRRPYAAPKVEDFLDKPVVFFATGGGMRGTRRGEPEPPR